MKIWQQVLAQQMKPLISPVLMMLTPREAPTFLGCFKLPVPPAVRRPQTITRAESCRQARKPSEGFCGLKHSFKCRRLKP